MLILAWKLVLIFSLSILVLLQINYKPGEANTEFARRFKHLAGQKIKTVGEAFAEFSNELGYTVNPLYKNMVTDIVGTTHLTVVCARFVRDPVWSLGIITALELLLKNYPEEEIGQKVVSSLFKSVGLDEAEVRAEAQSVIDWSAGKSRADVEAALSGEGDSCVATVAKSIKADEFWMYSRFFGIGMLKIMQQVGVEMDKDEVYPVMENWMGTQLGRPTVTACVSTNPEWCVDDRRCRFTNSPGSVLLFTLHRLTVTCSSRSRTS
jgi:hypothetical protein